MRTKESESGGDAFLPGGASPPLSDRNLRITTSQARGETQMKITNILTIIIIIVSGIACFALPPAAQADCVQGCFTNANTVFGDNALSSYVGFSNTAIGTEA